MNKDLPIVSIITVCFNSEKTIAKTIESVLSQTYPRIEYIIIDGKSTDRTVSVANSYITHFKTKGMKYQVISEKDAGIYDAMNKGIALSKGELVGIINSDDWYEADAAAVMVQAYRKTGFDLAYADLRMLTPTGKAFIKRARKRRYITSRDWNHPTQFVARRVYDRFKYRCENISDDMDFWFRVIREGYKIKVIHKVLANFQMGGVSNKIPLREVVPRIRRRYRIYRRNGFGRGYIVECVVFEVLKFILA